LEKDYFAFSGTKPSKKLFDANRNYTLQELLNVIATVSNSLSNHWANNMA